MFYRHTTSQELYPLNTIDQTAVAGVLNTTSGINSSITKKHMLGSSITSSNHLDQLLQKQSEEEEQEDMLMGEEDVMLWSTERVRKWLVQTGLEDLYGKNTGKYRGFALFYRVLCCITYHLYGF